MRGLRSSTRPNLRAYFLYFKPLYPLRTDSQPSQGSSLWCPRGSKTGTGRALVTFGINLNSSPAALLTRASDSAVCSQAPLKNRVSHATAAVALAITWFLASIVHCSERSQNIGIRRAAGSNSPRRRRRGNRDRGRPTRQRLPTTIGAVPGRRRRSSTRRSTWTARRSSGRSEDKVL